MDRLEVLVVLGINGTYEERWEVHPAIVFPTKSGGSVIRNPRSDCARDQSKIFDPGGSARNQRKKMFNSNR
jgi:hypothetical protein